jgi:serine protease SohB
VIDFFARLVPRRFRSDIPVVPVVRISGVIGVVTPLRPGLLLSTIARSLERAFNTRHARAVALIINSPGGSPSQSHLIFQRIRQLAEEKQIPVLAFVEDIGASGGYMLACAGDEIICNEFSIVGSIGVVGASFGFPKLMEKVGIDRRLYTSGDRKAMLDPFLPEKPEDVKRIKAIQQNIHEHFIALVKERRGSKLNGSDKTLFSGGWSRCALCEEFVHYSCLASGKVSFLKARPRLCKTCRLAEGGTPSSSPKAAIPGLESTRPIFAERSQMCPPTRPASQLCETA